jgi:OmpA-OmpF porin, OOP family
MDRVASVVSIMLLTAAVGCVSKNYVRQQVTPIINKVNELDDLTAENTRTIKAADQKLQAATQQADESATAADQRAQEAAQKAQQAQTSAEKAGRQVETIQRVVISTDDYRVVNEATLQFEVDRSDLTEDSKKELDQLASAARDIKRDIVCIEGFTDSTGAAENNYSLSTQRANSVRQYLVAQHSVPAYRIHTIGLGADTPVASNKTGEGRAKNRRAKVQWLSNSVESAATAAIR